MLYCNTLTYLKKLKQKSLEEYSIRHIVVKDTYDICAILFLLQWSHLREVFYEDWVPRHRKHI